MPRINASSGLEGELFIGVDVDGQAAPGVDEPFRTWEVFYWTPRR